MAYPDIFRPGNIKAMTTLTTAIQDIKFVPGYLQSLNLTGARSSARMGITTKTFQVEFRTDTQRILPIISELGPRTALKDRNRSKLSTFDTYRIGVEDTLRFSEIQDVRAFGTETMVERAPEVFAQRQSQLVSNCNLTMEFRNLAMINGQYIDSDGSVILDSYTEFGIARPTEINFDWANKTDVTGFIKQQVIRPLARAIGGRFPMGARIIAICDSVFYDLLIRNAEVRVTYLQTEEARALRANREGGVGMAFSEFVFGDVVWVDYRGTDDTSTVAVPSGKCRIFVEGVQDMFIERWAPKEDEMFVNTLGLQYYPNVLPDPSGEKMFWKATLDNYSMHLCTTPQALLQGRAA